MKIIKMLPFLNKLQSLKKYHGHNHSSMPNLLNTIGYILKDSPLSQQSLNLFLNQYRIEVHNLGYQHPNLEATLYNIGQVYAKNDQLSEATHYYTEAFLILSKNKTKGQIYALNI